MIDYIKKIIQITGFTIVVFGTAICDHTPAQAADISQLFGADLTWQCGMTPSIRPRIRLSSNELAQDSVRFNVLPCDPAPAPEPKPAPKPPEAPLTQLIQQGVQMLQTAQPLIQQLVQPLTAIGTPPAQPTPQSR